jgi:hypothetical protein
MALDACGKIIRITLLIAVHNAVTTRIRNTPIRPRVAIRRGRITSRIHTHRALTSRDARRRSTERPRRGDVAVCVIAIRPTTARIGLAVAIAIGADEGIGKTRCIGAGCVRRAGIDHGRIACARIVCGVRRDAACGEQREQCCLNRGPLKRHGHLHP